MRIIGGAKDAETGSTSTHALHPMVAPTISPAPTAIEKTTLTVFLAALKSALLLILNSFPYLSRGVRQAI